jgi:hypothetical protein
MARKRAFINVRKTVDVNKKTLTTLASIKSLQRMNPQQNVKNNPNASLVSMASQR